MSVTPNAREHPLARVVRSATAARTRGFSLPELMVVVAIIGILAAVAVPSYSEHLRGARRTDATLSLISLAARMERYYGEHGTYASATIAANPATDVLSNADTPEGHYSLSIVGGETSATAFKIKATRKSGTAQSNDGVCGDFTLTDLGLHGITGSGSVSECW